MERSYRMGGFRRPAFLVVAIGLLSARARAESVALDFEAPAECAGREQFAEHLSRRSPRLTIDSRAERHIRVEVFRDPFESVGTLRLTGPDGTRATRRVEARSCDEVVTALALVTVVALEEHQPRTKARRGRGVGAAEREVDASSAGENASEAAARDAGGTPEASEGVLVASADDYSIPVYDAPADPLRAAIGPPGPRGWWGLGFQAGVVGGVLPRAAFAPRLFVDARLDRKGVFTPAFRLSATRAIGNEPVLGVEPELPAFGAQRPSDASPPRVKLTWTSGRADVCPLSFPLGQSTAALWPCATLEGGWIDLRGKLPSEQRDERYGWFALGSVARLQWILHHVLLVEIETGAEVPLVRPPRGSLYRPAALAAYASGGIGGRFP